MKRVSSFTLLIILGLLMQPLSVVRVASAAPNASPEVTEETDGITVRWVTPPFTMKEQEDGAVTLSIQGFKYSAKPGEWNLPQSTLMAAVPRNARPSFEIIAEETISVGMPGVPQRVKPAQGAKRGLVEYERQAQPANQPVFALQELGILRGIRLVRLTFTPFYLDQDHSQWKFAQTLQVRIRFNTSTAVDPAFTRQSLAPDEITSQLLKSVVNPTQVQIERTVSANSWQKAQAAVIPALYLEVASSGLTQIRYEDLVAAGWDMPSTNPHRLQLWQGNGEIAMEWEGDDDAAFEAGERLFFYANIRPSRWTVKDAYRLEQRDTDGKRMTTRAASSSGLPAGSIGYRYLAETNLIYTPDCICGSIPAGPDGDHWTWAQLSRPDRSSASFPFQLSAVNTQAVGRLSVWMIGYTDVLPAPVDHKVNVALNGTPLGEILWNGKALASGVFDLPAGSLLEGENTLSLTLPGIPKVSVEGAWLDRFQIDYVKKELASLPAVFTGAADTREYTIPLPATPDLRGYDITDPNNPVRLTGLPLNGTQITLTDDAQAGPHAYLITADSKLNTPSKMRAIKPLRTAQTVGAGYLIITHPDFLAALNPLIALRTGQGFSVMVEDVEAIYDFYSDSRLDPNAIRQFLSDAFHNWNPPPSYVLLVGDGNYDPKNHLGGTPPTFIPPFLEDVDPWTGETAADNRYVAVDGADTLPDMMIGRLPVNTLQEAGTVIDKIVEYDQKPLAGNWPRAISMITDDPDQAGDFPNEAEKLAVEFDPIYNLRRYYYTPPYRTAEQLKKEIAAELNRGASLVIYSGHSSIHQWAEENFFHISQVTSLQNGRALPIMLEMTCFTSSFHTPGLDVLDEALLRYGGGGAVATWGSTGLGLLKGHEALSQSFISEIYHGTNTRLGMAVLAGKTTIALEQPYNIDLLDTFTLLGDPATTVNLVPNNNRKLYLPTVHRWK